MLGGMQDFELRVPRIIEHAEREHGNREIVSYWPTARSPARIGQGSHRMRGSLPKRLKSWA